MEEKECQHEFTKKIGHIYEDGYLVEYTEKCTRCGEERVWSYGSYVEE